jgi:uncharacterized membrane protein
LLTGIFFLVAGPYKRDHFVRFHAYQAIFLSFVCLAVYVAADIFLGILPGRFWRLGEMLHLVLSFGFFCLWVFLMYKAYHNEEFKVPVIGELAAKQA